MSVICCYYTITKIEIRVFLKHYWKQDYETVAAVRRICEVKGEGVVSKRVAQQWFQLSTLMKKTLKIYHVLEDLNYGILRIYAEFWKKIRKKSARRLSEELSASKDTIHRQIKTLENHTEAVDLFLMNLPFNRLNEE